MLYLVLVCYQYSTKTRLLLPKLGPLESVTFLMVIAHYLTVLQVTTVATIAAIILQDSWIHGMCQ